MTRKRIINKATPELSICVEVGRQSVNRFSQIAKDTSSISNLKKAFLESGFDLNQQNAFKSPINP